MDANPPLTQGNEEPHPGAVAVLGPMQTIKRGWWNSRNDYSPGSSPRKGPSWALKDQRAGKLLLESNPLWPAVQPQNGALLSSASAAFSQGVPAFPAPPPVGTGPRRAHAGRVNRLKGASGPLSSQPPPRPPCSCLRGGWGTDGFYKAVRGKEPGLAVGPRCLPRATLINRGLRALPFSPGPSLLSLRVGAPVRQGTGWATSL